MRQKLEEILAVLENDNCTAWDMQPGGSHLRRQPAPDEERRSAQEVFMYLADTR